MSTTADYVDSDVLAFHPGSTINPSRMHHHHRPPSKPNGGTRFLALILQALVMATALFLFFLFAGIAAIVLVHLFIAGRCLRHRRREDNHHHHACVISQGLSREELKSIACTRYASRGKHAAALTWGRDCAVCLEGFRDGDRYRVMPECGHAFHKGCVDRWLVKTRICPTCRTEVVVRGAR